MGYININLNYFIIFQGPQGYPTVVLQQMVGYINRNLNLLNGGLHYNMILNLLNGRLNRSKILKAIITLQLN